MVPYKKNSTHCELITYIKNASSHIFTKYSNLLQHIYLTVFLFLLLRIMSYNLEMNYDVMVGRLSK